MLVDSVQQQAEGAEQIQSITSRNPQDSSLLIVENEHLMSKETSKVTSTDPQKKVKNDVHRKRLKSSSRKALKERKQDISPPQSRENGNKVLFF